MNIVLLDANTLGGDLDLTTFETLGQVTTYGFTTAEEVAHRIKTADIIITNKVILNETNLSKAQNVKLICLTATGTNNVDKTYTNARGIVVSNVVGYSTDSVAQHTFALLFYLYEKLPYYDRYVKSGAYAGDRLFTHFAEAFHELAGKTWGIMGMGHIGQKVAAIATAFGAHVQYYSTSGQNNDQPYDQKDLATLLATSDILSIHAPLNDATQGLMGYDQFKQMKPSAILLNLGRGPIVVEADLARALDEHLIAAAGLDVLTHEPINPDNPLLNIQDSKKLLITPHIAWASVEARQRVVREVYENIQSFKAGTPRNQVTA